MRNTIELELAIFRVVASAIIGVALWGILGIMFALSGCGRGEPTPIRDREVSEAPDAVFQALLIETAADAPQGRATPAPNQKVGKWLIHNRSSEQAMVRALFLQVDTTFTCQRPCALSLRPDAPESVTIWRMEHRIGEKQGYDNWLALELNIAIAPGSSRAVFLVADTDDATKKHVLGTNLFDVLWNDKDGDASLDEPHVDWRTLTY